MLLSPSFLLPLLSIIPSTLATYGAPTIPLPATTGPYHVGHIHHRYTNPIPDPFNSTHQRYTLVHHMWPITGTKSNGLKTPYGPAGTLRAFESNLFPLGYPANSLDTIGAFFENLPKAALPNGWQPDVLFTPDLHSSTTLHVSLLEDLASHGYKVAIIDHQYDSIAVEYNTTATGEPIEDVVHEIDQHPTEDELRDLYLPTRLNDIKFVLDKLNARKVVVVGHGLGGTAAVEAVRKWPGRLVGAVNMNGKLWDTRDCAGRPVLLMGAEGESHPDWALFRKVKLGWLKWVTVKGFKKWGFSDAGFLADKTGVAKEVKELYTGSASGERKVELQRRWVRDFVGFALGKTYGGIVNGWEKEGWGEVKFE